MLKSKIAFAAVGFALLAACSSSSSSSGGNCSGFSSASVFTGTATLTSNSSTTCPGTMTIMNSGSDSGASASDGGPDPCAPVFSGCTATVSCDDNGTTISAHLTASGKNVSGTESITATASGMSIMCTYDVTGTYD